MYEVFRTDSFADDLKQHKRNAHLLAETDKKIQRMKTDPYNVGKSFPNNIHDPAVNTNLNTLLLK